MNIIKNMYLRNSLIIPPSKVEWCPIPLDSLLIKKSTDIEYYIYKNLSYCKNKFLNLSMKYIYANN